MFETEPEKLARSNLQLFLGFLLGIVAGLGCLFVAIFFGKALEERGRWIYPAIDAIALMVVGIFALKRVRQSSFAVGAVIALAVALLLDAGFAFYLSR
jgi:uncharacterized BrkB/YihY/UPF0761 family membrane protein